MIFLSKKNLKIIPVNFNKPWWYLLWQEKWLFLLILVTVTITQIIWSLFPFIIAKIFEIQSLILCIIIFAGCFVLDFILGYIRLTYNTKFQLQCVHSIYYYAHNYLLTIDPHYHIYRSSGAIVAKIERAARGFEDFADYISFEFVPLIIGLITVIVALAYYSFILAFIMSCFVITILTIGYYFSQYQCQQWEVAKINKDDKFKATALENLTQLPLIRSTFASNFRNNLLQKTILENMNTESILWIAYGYLFTFMGLLYIVSLGTLAAILLWHIKYYNMTAATALGLFLVYVQSSKEIVRFGRLLRKTVHSKTAVNDLFNFMTTFGKQTFPVLGKSTIEMPKDEDITINASNIHFDYGRAILFNDHTFQLSCSQEQPSKLYGIIGPSGIGKTTLLSVLGGQLKPTQGNVVINDIDIYHVNDAVRCKLIALQGQVASNIRGTVKSNLLLGLPEDHHYEDQDLVDVLQHVGLLRTLHLHNGLETLLGEGGLNLSGGQRQRLNFASLYLRAQYFKPLLVLIDEPTSSLDEISETAITTMIEQIAQYSVTLVVAHRLKTIEKAIGIIDLSLLAEEKIIKTYSKFDLSEHSKYYRELLEGNVTLDN